jgi:hypothetical protein
MVESNTTYIIGAPQVHLHYCMDDDEAKKNGYGIVEFCCHDCGTATVVTYDVPPKDVTAEGDSPILKQFRGDFETEHRNHKGLGDGYKILCSPFRKTTDFADLRG